MRPEKYAEDITETSNRNGRTFRSAMGSRQEVERARLVMAEATTNSGRRRWLE